MEIKAVKEFDDFHRAQLLEGHRLQTWLAGQFWPLSQGRIRAHCRLIVFAFFVFFVCFVVHHETHEKHEKMRKGETMDLLYKEESYRIIGACL